MTNDMLGTSDTFCMSFALAAFKVLFGFARDFNGIRKMRIVDISSNSNFTPHIGNDQSLFKTV